MRILSLWGENSNSIFSLLQLNLRDENPNMGNKLHHGIHVKDFINFYQLFEILTLPLRLDQLWQPFHRFGITNLVYNQR